MISKERREEEARLDAMMEIERVNELKKLEEREKKRIEGIDILSRCVLYFTQSFLC